MTKLFVIRKGGYYYRPNAQGYTGSLHEAGLYPEAEAVAHMMASDAGKISIFPAPAVPASVEVSTDIKATAERIALEHIASMPEDMDRLAAAIAGALEMERAQTHFTPQPWKDRETFTFDLDAEMVDRLDALAERCEKQGIGILATANYHGQGRVHVPAKWLRQIIAGYSASLPPQSNLSVADFAKRLFDLRGFMLLHSAGSDGKPTITISFPDLKEAQQFHNTLVELSQHRAATAGSDNG